MFIIRLVAVSDSHRVIVVRLYRSLGADFRCVMAEGIYFSSAERLPSFYFSSALRSNSLSGTRAPRQSLACSLRFSTAKTVVERSLIPSAMENISNQNVDNSTHEIANISISGSPCEPTDTIQTHDHIWQCCLCRWENQLPGYFCRGPRCTHDRCPSCRIY